MKNISILICMLASMTGMAPHSALALNLVPTTWNGHVVLMASGEIVEGDTARVADALRLMKPLPHGLPVVLLNSTGGSVAEALRLSALFTQKPIHAVIPAGAQCASACASILFIAGKNRTIEEGDRAEWRVFLGVRDASYDLRRRKATGVHCAAKSWNLPIEGAPTLLKPKLNFVSCGLHRWTSH